MKLTASINAQGQVALESLLLWAGLAAMLAILVPSLSNLMNAQSLVLSFHEYNSFSQQVDATIQQVSFSAIGTIVQLHVPSIEGLSAETLDQTLYIDYDHPSFSQRKTREIHSPLPIEVETLFPAESWRIERTENGISIQSQSEVSP